LKSASGFSIRPPKASKTERPRASLKSEAESTPQQDQCNVATCQRSALLLWRAGQTSQRNSKRTAVLIFGALSLALCILCTSDGARDDGFLIIALAGLAPNDEMGTGLNQ